MLDIGTHTVRLGYSGDDTPSVLVPSCYGIGPDGRRWYGEAGLGVPRNGMEIRPLFRYTECLEMDKEGLVGLLKWAIEERLGTKGTAHPVLLVDSPHWSKDLREEIVTVLFDQLEVPAVFLGRSPVLSAFSTGKHTGLVVDLGAHGIAVSPVFDGYVVKAACFTQKCIGGRSLTAQCHAMLSEHQIAEHCIGTLPIEISRKETVELGAPPVFTRQAVGMAESFRAWHQSRIVEDLKETIMQISDATLASEADVAMRPPKYYEFPSGFNKAFGFDRFRLGETIFQPGKYAYEQSVDATGLSELIHKAVQTCDVDLRPSIISSVLLCGGGASIAGLSERLNADLNRMPTFGRVRVQVSTTTNERRNAAWIGGSILASLGSFQQLWLTRQEFQEHGASFIERKAP